MSALRLRVSSQLESGKCPPPVRGDSGVREQIHVCYRVLAQVRDKGRKRGDDVLRVSGYAKRVEPRAVILGKLRGVVRGKIERTIIHIPGNERNGAAIGLHESGNVVNFWCGFGTVSDALRVCEMHVSIVACVAASRSVDNPLSYGHVPANRSSAAQRVALKG